MLMASKQFLFFLSALGAFNGMLLAGYLVFSKQKDKSYWFLSALLVMLSIRVGKSVLFYFYPELDKNILQLGLSACFLIGPMGYFYSKLALQQHPQLSLFDKIHLLTLVGVTLIFGYLFPYRDNVQLWGEYVYKVVNYTWLLYVILSVQILNKSFSSMESLRQRENLLLLSVNLGMFCIWLAYFLASYTSYILGALSFSFILYLTLILFLKYDTKPAAEPYKDKKLDDELVDELSQSLHNLMHTDEYYCDSRISLPLIAQKLGVTTGQISQLLNDNMNKPFNTYLNELRIDKAKKLLLQDERANMENIAEACGYNSMSTFYAAFKKVTSTTPAKYRADK